MIRFLGPRRRGPAVTLTGSDLRPKTERGSVATHDLAGETRAAEAAREDNLATGAPIPEQSPPPPPYREPVAAYGVWQKLATVLFPRSSAHGVLIDQDAPRSGLLGVTGDEDRQMVAIGQFYDKVQQLLDMDRGRFPRIWRAESRGDESRMGPKAAMARRRWGLLAVADAVWESYQQTGKVPEGAALLDLLDNVEDQLPADGESRAEARTRTIHRLKGLLRKL